MAAFAAALAAKATIVTNHLTLTDNMRLQGLARQFEMRASAYTDFLARLNRAGSPQFRLFLHVGRLADEVASDSEIQDLEYRIASLLHSASRQDLYLQFHADMALLRLHGSNTVIGYADDLSKALLGRHESVEWANHPQEARLYYHRWVASVRSGVPYGYEPQVDEDDLLAVVSIAQILSTLVAQMHAELQRGVLVH